MLMPVAALGAPSELGRMHIGTPSATTGTSLKDRDNGSCGHMHGDMDVTRLRCLHITLIIFGCIHVIIGILFGSVGMLFGFVACIVGMLFGFVPGILGIVSGSVINPCVLCPAPASGIVKCAAIMSIINSVLHVAAMGFTIWLTVEISTAMDLVIDFLVLLIIWYFISLVICATAAVTAWREASKLSAADTVLAP